MGHHKDKIEKEEMRKGKEGVRDVHVHSCPRSTRISGYTYVDVCTLPGRCTERPAAMSLDAYSWKLT